MDPVGVESIDELESELRERLKREDPPSGGYVDFARSIFDLRDVEVVHFQDNAGVGTRSQAQRSLFGEHAGSSLACELTADGLTGYLRGRPIAALVVQEPDGRTIPVGLGPEGSFEVGSLPSRFRLLVRPEDGEPWATTWMA
jgi:hypothetical protein